MVVGSLHFLLMSLYSIPCWSLSCYQCPGNKGECKGVADPGQKTECPSITSLIKPSLLSELQLEWTKNITTLAVQNSNTYHSLILLMFRDIPASIKNKPIVDNLENLKHEMTLSEVTVIITNILEQITEETEENACVHVTKKGIGGAVAHHRHCLYTNRGAGYHLSDWPLISAQMTKMMAREKALLVARENALCESCGDGCNTCQCAKPLCNTNGTYQCRVCQGPQNMCKDGDDKGLAVACPATHLYCIKEMSADNTNRELVARYCGTEFDKEELCGSGGETANTIGVAASGRVTCCSNRQQMLCNGQRNIKFSIRVLFFPAFFTYVYYAL